MIKSKDKRDELRNKKDILKQDIYKLISEEWALCCLKVTEKKKKKRNKK